MSNNSAFGFTIHFISIFYTEFRMDTDIATTPYFFLICLVGDAPRLGLFKDLGMGISSGLLILG